MRSALREKGVRYFVAKKTLTNLALKDSEVEGDVPEFEGELAITASEDETASAREIYEFQKKFDERVSIQGGVFGGVFQDKAHMLEIAQIPGLDTLRGMFVNIINSPIQRFAIAMGQVAEKKGQ